MSGLGLVLVFVDLFLLVVPGYAMMRVVALLLGTVIVIHPSAGIDTLALIVGICLIVLGMMRIAHGITERHEEQAIIAKHRYFLPHFCGESIKF